MKIALVTRPIDRDTLFSMVLPLPEEKSEFGFEVKPKELKDFNMVIILGTGQEALVRDLNDFGEAFPPIVYLYTMQKPELDNRNTYLFKLPEQKVEFMAFLQD